MNDIPPKHTPEDAAVPGGNLVSFYPAASNANSESFPVLKAFQDYIEAERAQARKRVFTLSMVFAVIICVVVGGFLAVGIYLLRDMSSLQGKLVDAALAPRAPAAPLPQQLGTGTPPPLTPGGDAALPSLVEETVKEITKVTTALQDDIGKRLDGVSEISSQVHEKVTSQETELEKLRQELGQMRELNDQLKGDFEAMRASAVQPPPARAGVDSPTPAAPSREPAAAPGEAVAGQPPVATPPVVARKGIPYPPETKDPPVPPEGVTPPPPPKGMMATSLPLESKNLGTIPWRIFIPE